MPLGRTLEPFGGWKRLRDKDPGCSRSEIRYDGSRDEQRRVEYPSNQPRLEV